MRRYVGQEHALVSKVVAYKTSREKPARNRYLTPLDSRPDCWGTFTRADADGVSGPGNFRGQLVTVDWANHQLQLTFKIGNTPQFMVVQVADLQTLAVARGMIMPPPVLIPCGFVGRNWPMATLVGLVSGPTRVQIL